MWKDILLVEEKDTTLLNHRFVGLSLCLAILVAIVGLFMKLLHLKCSGSIGRVMVRVAALFETILVFSAPLPYSLFAFAT